MGILTYSRNFRMESPIGVTPIGYKPIGLGVAVLTMFASGFLLPSHKGPFPWVPLMQFGPELVQ